jgi:RNA polymerase sigma-70 factor, ECF subfamily
MVTFGPHEPGQSALELTGASGRGTNADQASVSAAVAAAYRAEWTRVLSTVIRVTRDFDLAEDCVQDAYAQALLSWARDGVPDRPGAWLTTVAVRRALQVHRRSATLATKLPHLLPGEGNLPFGEETPDAFENLPDDRLRLVFTCCHPALSPDGRVALTLRLVCGLSSKEVARTFLVKEATMQARITRAKKKIAEAGIPYRTPAPAEFPERLGSVLDTVYLVYSAGHVAPTGENLMRADLADRGLDIGRMLHELLPDDAETTALLALLLLTDARRQARLDHERELVLLKHQDRGLWDRRAIAEGRRLLETALSTGSSGKYAVMASIAAVHVEAMPGQDPDWAQIIALYGLLLQRWPSPVVVLNRAVAVGELHGPAAGLEELLPLMSDPSLAAYPYLPATRADFLRRLGRCDEAADAYRQALLLTDNRAEAAFLRKRLDEVGGP